MAIRETNKNVLKFDEMIGSTDVTAIMQNISITAGTAMERGAILTSTGEVVGTGGTAEYVLADDVSATDTVATVYVSGCFNREKLTVASSDTVDAHEAQLRDKNIYLTSIE